MNEFSDWLARAFGIREPEIPEKDSADPLRDIAPEPSKAPEKKEYVPDWCEPVERRPAK